MAVAACAPPAHNTGNLVLTSPTPSVSPTPTTAFAASGPGFHAGEVGVAYAAVALTASGGVAPYHFTLGKGSLPPGTSLGTDGTVSGTPAAAGHYAFTIQAADSGDSTAPIPGAIDVAPALSVSLTPACAQYCNVELGCVNACGAFGSQSGGVAPFAYSVTSGQLPSGTTLSGLSLKGTFTGLAGFLGFSVRVTDALGATGTVSPIFWMWAHVSWSGTWPCNGTYLSPCTVTIPFNGGVPGGQPTVKVVGISAYCSPTGYCYPAPPSVPQTFSAVATTVGSDGGGRVTITVQQACGGACGNGYEAVLSVRLFDQAPCAPGGQCSSGALSVPVYIQGG